MVARGRVGGETPERVVTLLREAVKASSQSAVARYTGLRLYSVQRYLKGVGEPTTDTMQKLADYFGVSVEWLRGYSRDMTYEQAKDRHATIGRIEGLESALHEADSRLEKLEDIEDIELYEGLISEYLAIPLSNRDEALKILALLKMTVNRERISRESAPYQMKI